jgi:hypothetical protein
MSRGPPAPAAPRPRRPAPAAAALSLREEMPHRFLYVYPVNSLTAGSVAGPATVRGTRWHSIW